MKHGSEPAAGLAAKEARIRTRTELLAQVDVGAPGGDCGPGGVCRLAPRGRAPRVRRARLLLSFLYLTKTTRNVSSTPKPQALLG